MSANFYRRQLLGLAGFLIAGTAVTVSVPFVSNLFASKAQAQETFEEVYKGRTITVVTAPDRATTSQAQESARAMSTAFETPVQLRIDGSPVGITLNRRTQRYVTSLLFGEFNSP